MTINGNDMLNKTFYIMTIHQQSIYRTTTIVHVMRMQYAFENCWVELFHGCISHQRGVFVVLTICKVTVDCAQFLNNEASSGGTGSGCRCATAELTRSLTTCINSSTLEQSVGCRVTPGGMNSYLA